LADGGGHFGDLSLRRGQLADVWEDLRLLTGAGVAGVCKPARVNRGATAASCQHANRMRALACENVNVGIPIEELVLESFEPVTWFKKLDEKVGPLNGVDWGRRGFRIFSR